MNLNVCVDSSWSAPASTTMQSAVSDAATQWNSSVSACSLSTGYYINPNQNCSVADIIVHSGTTSAGTCAENALNSVSGSNRSGPDTITMLARVANDEGSAARLLQHEIGHSLGLTHQSGSSCGTAPSVMNLIAPLSTCFASPQSVTTADVGQVYTSETSPSKCTINVYSPDYLTAPTPCPSGPSCGEYLNLDWCSYPDNGCPYDADYVAGPLGQDCCDVRSPILIDVTGNGFNLTSQADGVFFDFVGDGTKIRTSRFGHHGPQPIRVMLGWCLIATTMV